MPGWEYSLRDSFQHFVQPGAHPNLLRMSCEMFMFRGTSSRLNIGRGTSGKTFLKTPEGPTESP